MMYIAVGAGVVGIVVTGSVARWLLRRWARAYVMDAAELFTGGMRIRDAEAQKSWDETFGGNDA